jgi:hypothetical protein
LIVFATSVRTAVGVAVLLLDQDQRRVLALHARAALALGGASRRPGEDADVLLVEPKRQQPAAGVLLRLPPRAEQAAAALRAVDEPGGGVGGVAGVLELAADDEHARQRHAVGRVMQRERAEQP